MSKPSPTSSPDLDGEASDEQVSASPALSLDERKAKMRQLRGKLAASAKANRTSVVEESTKSKISARDAARLEKQRKLAETLRTKADAAVTGVDLERNKNWEYTIEENEEWEKRLARKARRADFQFRDETHMSRMRYKKDTDLLKPDLDEYRRRKALAMGPEGSMVASFDPTSGQSSAVVSVSHEQQMAHDGLYRDSNSLIYGDNKPSDAALDRVVNKIDEDLERRSKFSRKRPNEDEGDITYINERNRVFNKKIARYYDKYTTEIRANFERGTAL